MILLIILVILVIIALLLSQPKIIGMIGEKAVSSYLNRLDREQYQVINNLLLHTNDSARTVQIDHVVVSNYGIFVIETKNYKGWIIGNENDEYWQQVIYKRKEKLHNPIRQNWGHIQALKSILNEFPDLPFYSIITFTTRADLKVKTNIDVVYSVNLIRTIKKYEDRRIEDDVKEQIFKKLNYLNIDSKENRQAHVAAIHNNINEKNNKIEADICPRCGETLIMRNGKYGQFKGCSNYPKCRFTLKV